MDKSQTERTDQAKLVELLATMKCVTCGEKFDSEPGVPILRPTCMCSVTSYRSSTFLESDSAAIVDQAMQRADEYEEHVRPAFLQRVADMIYEEIMAG